MHIRLKRFCPCGNSLPGAIYIDGKLTYNTLENNARKIPTGFYPVRLTMSPRFGEILPLIDRVIGRSGIRIHPGNTAADSAGCVLVGTLEAERLKGGKAERRKGGEADEPRLLYSRACFNKLRDKLLATQRKGEEIWINITEPENPTNAGYDYATAHLYEQYPDERTVVYVFGDEAEPV